MNKTYFETLPKDYFGNLYQKVVSTLTKGENVSISVIPGFGEKTIFNFLNFHFAEEKIFDNTFVYDPQLDNENLIKYTSIVYDRSQGNTLLIIRFFENNNDKPKILEKLDSIKRKNPKKLTFLVFTNEEALLNPQTHQAISTTFFSEMIFIKSFDIQQTEKMIVSLSSYYGWLVNNQQIKEIYLLSGGIPRLIKYLVKESYESKIIFANIPRLIVIPQISFQLKLLSKIIITHKNDELSLMGLIDEKNVLKSKLLKYYLKNFKSELVSKFYPQLGESEIKILSFFIENEEQILTLDNIAALMKMTDENFSLWAIYKMISRLRPKVKNNFKIINLKSKGYKLTKISH